MNQSILLLATSSSLACIAYAIHTIYMLVFLVMCTMKWSNDRCSSRYNWTSKNSSKAHCDPKTRNTFGRDAILMGLRGIPLPVLIACTACQLIFQHLYLNKP